MFKFIKKYSKQLGATALAVGLFGASNVHAAYTVDADVASTTAAMVLTLTQNVGGVITTNLPAIVIIGVLIFSITFLWKLARRFMSSR